MDQKSTTFTLHNIGQGMAVYDSKGELLGNVRYVQHMGKGSDDNSAPMRTNDWGQPEHDFLEDILSVVFDGDDLMHAPLRERLKSHGYFRVAPAANAAVKRDYFICGDQVASLASGNIFLGVAASELLARRVHKG